MMGGLAVLASLLVSRKLTNPIKELVSQTVAIREGELGRRAAISSSDEIGRLSSAFNRMADDLEFQESLKRKLIANVAHELRTPLAAMRGELEGMADGVLPISNEQIHSLLEETERLRNILDGIDDLTKAQASSLDLRIEKINLKSFLGNIRDRFHGQFQEKGITLEVEVKDDDSALADPDSLSQVIINLLSNALRATPKGGRVTMRAGVLGKDAFLEVADTGEGIREEDLPFIFERFYRSADGGLGLGLAIVRELVDAHGGHISVHSKPGLGTTMKVFLPGGLEER
jgi:two-component system sensor histidine kinase BaeS